MKFNNQSGYILFINLILITLIALFIPLLIQQQKLNFRILNNRITAAQNKEAVESALQYQLYFLKNENLLLEDKINLNGKFELKIRGEEDDNYFYLKAELFGVPSYRSEMKIEKESLQVINKKIYRSE
ncbi:MAG: hypothetical protein ACLFUK_01715 [Halanaerobium sp.]